MTKKQMKEELMWKVNYNREQAIEWFRKCNVKDIEEGTSKYTLYREYAARAYENIDVLECLGFITKAEIDELYKKTIEEITRA